MGIFDKLFKKQIDKKARTLSHNNIQKYITKLEQNIKAYNSSYRSNRSGGGGGSKWPYGLSADGRTRVIDHHRLRMNARDAFHDSIDMRAIVERFADNVIDTGLILDPSPMHEILSITPEEAEAWGANVAKRFHLWARCKKQHRSGTLNFYQFQRLYEVFQQRDNDIFVRFYYSKSKKLQNPLQYEFIDPNQIRGDIFTNTYMQLEYRDGIKKNDDGTEKAYKIWIKDSQGHYKSVEVLRIGPKSGRIMMIHGFNPEYAGQSRGYSRLGFALQELENITDFSVSIIKKAINNSNLLLSVENQQQDPGNPFEGLTNEKLSAMGAELTAEPATDEIKNVDRFYNLNVCPIPEAGLDTPGSTAVVGNQQGDTVRILDNKVPNESFKDFIGAFLERLCAATGNPIEVVLMKFGQNYSASRATLVLAWRVYCYWRQEAASDCFDIVYESWLNEEIAAGRIIAPGFMDPVLKKAWLNCNWIGSRMPDIDPGKTAKAAKDNLEMNLTTLEREARNLNGSSAKENIIKNTKSFSEMPSPPWSKGQTEIIENEISENEEDKEDEKNG